MTLKNVSYSIFFTLFALSSSFYVHAQESIESQQAASEDTSIEVNEQEPQESLFGLGLIDYSHQYASTSVNSIAKQLDQFFGVQRSDLEAAYSSLRLTFHNSWTPQKDHDDQIQVRGKIHLPRVNERISLIFSDANGNVDNYYQNDLDRLNSDTSTQLNLQYVVQEKSRHRLDFRLGLSSSFQGRTSLRYRYENSFSDHSLVRLTEKITYKDGAGFSSSVRLQLDNDLGTNTLLRWTNDMLVSEQQSGMDWHTEFAYLNRRSNETAISYFGRLNGNTSQGFISSYDIGFRFRKNISRPWLFVEVEPGYTWYKENRESLREGEGFILISLEFAVGKY